MFKILINYLRNLRWQNVCDDTFAVKGPQADLTWSKGAKRQMANLERFIEKLVSFDEHGPPPESTLHMLESTYLKNPSCDPDHLQNLTDNSACAALCRWVKGVCRFELTFLY
jgi:dynein heavy chain, axonemal